MKKKLIETLKWVVFIIALLCMSFIDILLLKNEMYIVCCAIIGNAVIYVLVVNVCEELYKKIIKSSKKRWRKSENGI